MRKGLGATTAALALLAGVTVVPASAAAPAATVHMVDNDPDLTNWHFDPVTVTVAVGGEVLWHNQGTQEHSVTADDSSFDSDLKKPGSDYTRTFPKVGTYAYHCRPHPWMKGVVQVVTSLSTTTTAPVAAATTTLPASLATQPGGPGDSTTTTATLAAPPAPAGGAAAPATGKSHSKRGLAATLAIVLVPTLAALGLGARLRRSRT
ncbi:MAG TPA: plastocyanin/azurin family copper-binding protein [Acidimicrobiia bacterium]|nr:plastocyanin/azurin family copper-binding protein [Acidimicrobiia bacterium]